MVAKNLQNTYKLGEINSRMFIEKYRPKTFSEVFGQADIVKRIEALTNSMNIPHLLFAGPPGIGKSTLALIVMKELFGEDSALRIEEDRNQRAELSKEKKLHAKTRGDMMVKYFSERVAPGLNDVAERKDALAMWKEMHMHWK